MCNIPGNLFYAGMVYNCKDGILFTRAVYELYKTRFTFIQRLLYSYMKNLRSILEHPIIIEV